MSNKSTSFGAPTDLGDAATKDISNAMNIILADTFALYFKTKNFHWHVSGPHFRDYHLLFDEQAAQLFGMTDLIAERVRKVGGSTIRSVDHIKSLQTIVDNDEKYVEPVNMLSELCNDNKSLVTSLRKAHEITDKYSDIATSSLIENWIDESERRVWFLYEAGRKATDQSGH